MASSAALASPSPLTAAQLPKPSVRHPINGGSDSDEEMEYEEIEVEVEVEELEDEVEEAEEGGNVSEVGDDLTPVREGDQEKGDRTSEKNDPKSSPDNSRKMTALETPIVRDITAASRTINSSKETCNVPIETSVVQDVAATLGTTDAPSFFSSRSPRRRLRDSSSISDFDGMNKKLRIACEFHAKGRCIKGNSCRFLHIRDGSDAAASASYISYREAAPSSSTRIQSQQMIYGAYLSHYCAIPNDDFNMNISSVGTLEGMTVAKSNLMRNDDGFAESSYSRSWHASSSWNNHAGVSSTFLEPSLKPHAPTSSSKPSNPPVSGSDAENISRNHPFTDTEPQMVETTKVISDDWEPSIPFHPSHPITRNLFSKISLYDPIHDCVEPNPVKKDQVKFSSSDQGSTVRNVRPQSNSSQEEAKHLSSSHVVDAAKLNFSDSSYVNQPKADDQRHGSNSNPKVAESGNANQDAVGISREEQSESKAFKSFHAALIEYVKDLVKPTWRQGLMTKDAHKVVVKKSVDKVLSTIQDDQFPSTPESVKLYLSSSHEKLAKLVEAYIERHGKV